MKTAFLQKVLRLGVKIEAVIRGLGQAIVRVFLSKAEMNRRMSGKLETLKRREMEAERLDRLINPGNYQGR